MLLISPTPTPDKENKRPALITGIISGCSISHAWLESLFGHRAFAQADAFGVSPFCAQAEVREDTTPAISLKSLPHLREIFYGGPLPFAASPFRNAFVKHPLPDWAVYTDAAYEAGGKGARMAAVFPVITRTRIF